MKGATAKQRLLLTSGAFVGGHLFMAANHGGAVGAIIASVAAYGAWQFADEFFEKINNQDGENSPRLPSGKRGLGYRLVTTRGKRFNHDLPTDEEITEHQRRYQSDDDFDMPQLRTGTFTFSHLLATGWRPSYNEIFLARLPDGTNVFVTVEQLVHIALSGATRNGKTSIIRMLLSQLIYVGCDCILLDPHFTPFDVKTREDWTPFVSKLKLDPMEYKEYSRIEQILRHADDVILAKRRVLRSQSKPVGRPIFILIDEYPAIMAQRPKIEGHIGNLLREGAKYDIYLCIASHDFLVQTAFPSMGSGLRDCLKTVFHAGGNIRTAKELLGMEQIDRDEEATLGKGRVYLRAETHKQAGLANTPWMDDEAIHLLVGPSTYVEDNDIEIELDDDDDPLADITANSYPATEVRQEATVKPNIEDKGPRAEDIDIDLLVLCWNGGANSVDKLMKAFKMTHHQATLARKRIMDCTNKHIEEATE
jgi:hypothetical protein